MYYTVLQQLFSGTNRTCTHRSCTCTLSSCTDAKAAVFRLLPLQPTARATREELQSLLYVELTRASRRERLVDLFGGVSCLTEDEDSSINPISLSLLRAATSLHLAILHSSFTAADLDVEERPTALAEI